MTRNEYFDHLLDMFSKHIESKDSRTEYEIQCSILNFIETRFLQPEDDENGGYLGDGKFADNH